MNGRVSEGKTEEKTSVNGRIAPERKIFSDNGSSYEKKLMRQAVSLWRSRKSEVVKLLTLQGGKVQIANKIGRHKILKQRFHQQWIAEEIFVQCVEGSILWAV